MLYLLSISMTSEVEVCDLCGKNYEEAEALLLKKAKEQFKVESRFSGKVTKTRILSSSRITYSNPIEKMGDLITEIDLLQKTLKKHSAEDIIPKDVYVDYSGYLKETPLLEQLLDAGYRSRYYDNFDKQIMNSNIMNTQAGKALENMKTQLTNEINEHKVKNKQAKTKIEALLEKSIKETLSKIAMVKTSININLKGSEDLKRALEDSGEFQIQNLGYSDQYNSPYVTIELDLCWVCSNLLSSIVNESFSTRQLD